VRRRAAFTALVVVAGLVPIALVAVDVARHAQNVPFWDEWADPLEIAIKTVEGELTLGDLLRQYNDSRPFFSNLLTALSARVAGWSLKLQMAASVAVAGGTLLLLVALLRASHPAAWLAAWVPLAALTFSLPQRRTWLWAVQSQYVFVVLFMVAAVYVVRRRAPGWPPLAASAAFLLGATFSYANGFLTWAVMIPVLWMLGYRARRYTVVWAGAAAAGLTAYFAGYQFRVERGLTFDPLFLGRFVTVYLGNALTVREAAVHPPLEISLNTALGALGLLVFALNVGLLWRAAGSGRDVAPWIGLALFVVVSAALAGSGRRQMGGIEVAMASRYVTLATLFWVALVATSIMAMVQLGAARRWIRHGNATALAILLVVFVAGSWRFAHARPTVTERARACFLAYPVSRDDRCFADIHPALKASESYGASRLTLLERVAHHKLAAFGEPPRP
jgi:hypothetical protein